jgi:hypothetical protein
MRPFLITIIRGAQRTERRVVADSSVEATIVGMLMSPEAKGPLSIFCKPLERIAQWQPDATA